jgi:hypothetical protein
VYAIDVNPVWRVMPDGVYLPAYNIIANKSAFWVRFFASLSRHDGNQRPGSAALPGNTF